MDANGWTKFQGDYFFAIEVVSNLLAKFLSDLWRVRVDDTDAEGMPIGFLFCQSHQSL
jgi:hypothetical protein